MNSRPWLSNFNENFVIDGRSIRPRSGLTRLGSSDNTVGAGDPVFGYFNEVETGIAHSVIFSSHTAIATTRTLEWEAVDGWPESNLSLDFSDFRRISAVQARDAEFGDIFCVFGSAVTPSYISNSDPEDDLFEVTTSASRITSLTSATTAVEYAKYAAALDDRLVLYNVRDAGGTRASRVFWSVRGRPRDFEGIGSGFEDLSAIGGEGTGIITHQDEGVVFSAQQVWRVRPRRDAFVFDFIPLDMTAGCPFPHTVTPTSFSNSIFWIGRHYQPYLLLGSEIAKFSPSLQFYLSRRLGAQTLNPFLEGRFVPGPNILCLLFQKDPNQPTAEVIYLYMDSVYRLSEDDTSLEVPWFVQKFDGHNVTAVGSHPLGDPKEVE